jgi:3-hexulose-6-phosphate synthase
MTTKLQLALDEVDWDDTLALVDLVQADIDIVEVGTPLLMRYGLPIVTAIKERFSHLEVLCDAKIIDAANYEARICFEAGADYVTFLALTDDLSVEACVAAASVAGRKVMADMICVPDLAERARRLEELGVDVIAVHTGVDQQADGLTPLDDLRVLVGAVNATPLAVAGGIDRRTLPDYLKFKPSIVIIGSGITRAVDVAAEARTIHQMIGECNQ